jgi:hypothetical protein
MLSSLLPLVTIMLAMAITIALIGTTVWLWWQLTSERKTSAQLRAEISKLRTRARLR